MLFNDDFLDKFLAHLFLTDIGGDSEPHKLIFSHSSFPIFEFQNLYSPQKNGDKYSLENSVWFS